MDVQPGKPASKGPANWFTGDVWIAPIGSGHEPNQLSLGNVHFTPGARTAWHSHTIAQTLQVTEGEGLVQARGEAVARIRPGDVVTIAGKEWHWHGAAPGHFMTTCPSLKATPNGVTTSPTPSTTATERALRSAEHGQGRASTHRHGWCARTPRSDRSARSRRRVRRHR
jgi:quercetin dioxygenase-like cupin family protein